MSTPARGIFAAGDIRQNSAAQLVSAHAGDGLATGVGSPILCGGGGNTDQGS